MIIKIEEDFKEIEPYYKICIFGGEENASDIIHNFLRDNGLRFFYSVIINKNTHIKGMLFRIKAKTMSDYLINKRDKSMSFVNKIEDIAFETKAFIVLETLTSQYIFNESK